MEMKWDFIIVKYILFDWLRLIKLLDLNIIYLVLVMFIYVCIYVYVVMFFVDIIYKYNICGSMYLWGKNICYFIKCEVWKRLFLYILWVSYKE